MSNKKEIGVLPPNFKREVRSLKLLNILTWDDLYNLTDEDLYAIVNKYFASINNLRKLRNIGLFICALNMEQQEASILMHTGISSLEALARCSPEDLISRTGRLERQLNTSRANQFNMKKANHLIQLAKDRQKQN